MVPRSPVPFLKALLGRLLRRRAEPPLFEGVLDELFAGWPLDARERGESLRAAA